MNPPVRYLWILRHAKASPDPPFGGRDKDRPLSGRGRRDAAALGKRLAAEPVDLDLGSPGVPRPELALCSAAARTRRTAGLIAEAFESDLPVSAYDSLYGADTELVLQYVREIDEEAGSALVVGHNPTVFDLAWRLLEEPGDPDDPTADRSILEAHGFPTCALAVVMLKVDAWEDVNLGSGSLTGVFKPPY